MTAQANNPIEEPAGEPQRSEPTAGTGPGEVAEVASDAARPEQTDSEGQAAPAPPVSAIESDSKPAEPTPAVEPEDAGQPEKGPEPEAAAESPPSPQTEEPPEEGPEVVQQPGETEQAEPEGSSQSVAEAPSQQAESQAEPSEEGEPPKPETQPPQAPREEPADRSQPDEMEPSVEAVEQAPAEAEEPGEQKPAAQAEEPPQEKPAAQAEKPAEDKPVEEPKSEDMDWYILKVQSNREESIRDGLLRRVAVAGLNRFFGDIIVPTEQVAEFKGGKKRIAKRKLYPGYLVVQMEINEDTWFLVRETPGIGDFTGAAGRPTPMLPHEVTRILATVEIPDAKPPKPRIKFTSGDRVKINEGTFENFEGEVQAVDETNGRVTVLLQIFNRPTPVELEYWQIESV